MTTGDIDNVLGPRIELSELCASNPGLDAYLRMAWNLAPCRSFFIPYGAGISTNGQRVYVSNDIQTIVDGVDCVAALVRHETTEWGLRYYCNIGEDYLSDPEGHRLANRAEFACVELLLGEAGWDRYNEILDTQIVIEERTEFAELPIPWDLALYPYPEAMRDTLVDAMHNQRSREEWRKLG